MRYGGMRMAEEVADDNRSPSEDVYSLFSRWEKRLHSLIERTEAACRILDNNDEVFLFVTPNILRQKMRNLRRWRNRSIPCSSECLGQFSRFLADTRRSLCDVEIQILRLQLSELDEASDVYDGNVYVIMEDVGDDITALEAQLSRLGNDDADVEDIENKIRELQNAINFLKTEISEINLSVSEDRGGDESDSISQSSGGDIQTFAFESNPLRNRALAMADRVRHLIQLFKQGHHDDVTTITDSAQSAADDADHVSGRSCHVMMTKSACAASDIEILRRQLRKIRRWRHNIVIFVPDDVNDLDFIVNQVESHLKDILPRGGSYRPVSRQDSTYGTMRGSRGHMDLTTIGAAPTSTAHGEHPYRVSPLPLHSDTSSIHSCDGGAEASLDGAAMDSLDENADFGERLI